MVVLAVPVISLPDSFPCAVECLPIRDAVQLQVADDLERNDLARSIGGRQSLHVGGGEDRTRKLAGIQVVLHMSIPQRAVRLEAGQVNRDFHLSEGRGSRYSQQKTPADPRGGAYRGIATHSAEDEVFVDRIRSSRLSGDNGIFVQTIRGYRGSHHGSRPRRLVGRSGAGPASGEEDEDGDRQDNDRGGGDEGENSTLHAGGLPFAYGSFGQLVPAHRAS